MDPAESDIHVQAQNLEVVVVAKGFVARGWFPYFNLSDCADLLHSTLEHCGKGCQPHFGHCESTSKKSSGSGYPIGDGAYPNVQSGCVPCEGQSGSLPYCGADIYTNNYEFTPKTCRTVYYTFQITEGTISPDGVPRKALLVNGQMPGPTIEANWGDTVVVTVTNGLGNNGTSLHFHGLRQLYNNEYDGVPSLTQCPIAPGDTMTYEFVLTNYGTSWWHSHAGIQTWDGIFGPLIVHGPTSKEYDVDAGTILMQDWSHATVDSMYHAAEDAINGGPQTMDTGLINGMNVWGGDKEDYATGKRFELETKFEPGKTYLFRLINGAIQSTYKFQIDGHKLEVINMDFTAIKPYTTNILNVNIGQRYMVLVKADQTPGSYWMRAENQEACAKSTQGKDIKGIVRYVDASDATPTTTPHEYEEDECVDEPYASLVPINKMNAAEHDLEFEYDVIVKGDGRNLYRWWLNFTTFSSELGNPTVLSYIDNNTIPNVPGPLLIDVPNLGEWIYIVLESAIPLPHPIHLHGHDFLVLAQGEGNYTHGETPVNFENPPRRDTVLLPGAGHLLIAWKSDNPGSWLLHCHIGWHTSMGFALQVLEAKDMIKDTIKDAGMMGYTCRKWNEWVSWIDYRQLDSGV
ncbi:Cupredoxin [Clohesyomyces aquaticus]|uniref:Cupredoxin n=1 Tax=Clohesyomyces aquaticus TaxID=1231657 RepID=A0A1Y1Z2G5_9PLEO|nr:Cupredoxin [Clohesyomyces aquaticus]